MPKDARDEKDHPTRPDEPRTERHGSQGEGEDPDGGKFFPDLLRRALTVGITGVFMTEEAVRRALGDSVPRDVVEFVLEQSERTRNELLDRLSREFGRGLSAVDPVEIAKRLLEGRTVEVTARVRLISSEEEESEKAEGK
jgi:hypothetical protein